MPLEPGARLGPYEIVELLGKGGMGEVYKARDQRLNRLVAIKIIRAGYTDDDETRQRFEHEGRLIAQISHPGVLVLHDFGIQDGTPYLVSEFVDGESLRSVVNRGPTPARRAIEIARQIAEGLAAAHDKGIVHRDLKPENVLIAKSGHAKILDFGIAKLTRRVAADSANLPTAPLQTEPGHLVGTAGYVSPEQVKGGEADSRSDIFAFGVVVYEMLSGRKLFARATAVESLNAILKEEPKGLAESGIDAPTTLERTVMRCLEKDPAKRFQSAHDLAFALENAEASPRRTDLLSVQPQGSSAWLPAKGEHRRLVGGLLAGALAVGAAAGWSLRPSPVIPEAHVELSTPPTTDTTMALSPDGRRIVFVAPDHGPLKLWVRSLDGHGAQPLAGTDRGTMPFWSPDGKSVGFFADTMLKKVDVDGGTVETIGKNIGVPLGGTWGADGTILYSGNPAGPVERIAATGGPPAAVTRVDAPKERGHHFPQLLPDGRHFIFWVSGNALGVYLGDLEGGKKKRLFDARSPAVYVEPGYLLFVRGEQLVAQRFDYQQGTMSGEVLVLGEPGSQTWLSAASGGTLAYRTTAGDNGQRQLLWLDRSGRELERVAYPSFAAQGPALSHDGRHVAVFRFLNNNMDVWSYDRQRQVWDRLTFDPGDDIYPLWSPDDRSIIYAGARNAAPLGFYKRLLSAPPESEQLLFRPDNGAFPMDWSTDGKYLLFTRRNPRGDGDIWALPLADPTGKPFEVVATDADEGLPQFSPDTKWVAYQSDKNGRDEVFVRPFPGPGPDIRVSPDGGGQARWNPKGEELFYISADDSLAAVSVAFRADGSVDIGRPARLFPTNIGSAVRLKFRQQYCVSPDGKAFLVNAAVEGPPALPIQLVLHWKPAR